MKYIQIILAIILLNSNISCNHPCQPISGTFKNKSGKDITAYSYKRRSSEPIILLKETKIMNDSSIAKTGEVCGADSWSIDFHKLLKGDSVVIDFGDKTKVFNGDQNDRFLMQKEELNNVYILTPEDYVNAMPK